MTPVYEALCWLLENTKRRARHRCSHSPDVSLPTLPPLSLAPPLPSFILSPFLPCRHYEEPMVVLRSQKSQIADIKWCSFASYIVLIRNPAHIRGIQALLEAEQNGFSLSPPPHQKCGCRSTPAQTSLMLSHFLLCRRGFTNISIYRKALLLTRPLRPLKTGVVGSAVGADKCATRNNHGKTSQPLNVTLAYVH